MPSSDFQLTKYLQYLATRSALGLLGLLPLSLRRKCARSLLRFVAARLPKLEHIANRNLSLAFPELSDDERRRLYLASFSSMADLVVDFARFPTLTKEWAETQIDFPQLDYYRRIKREEPDKGIILATGHLGSFELSAFCLPLLVQPISFIVRRFSNPFLDRWWTKIRESNGNTVVERSGAYRSMVQHLQAGKDVGILFDQNVARKNALFVDWFGRPAATTKALALAALRTKARVFLVAIVLREDNRYLYELREYDCTDIYQDQRMNKKEKLQLLTERLSAGYQELIRKHAESWFWFHRRWKTTPEGVPEDFYSPSGG